MAKAIPTLNVEGFIKDTDTMVIKLYEYFIVSEYSQSNTFRGNISSLKYILQSNTDILDIKNEIVNTLETMYGRYFDSVTAIVDVTEDGSMVNYAIDIIVIDSNNKTNRLVNVVNTVGDSIININDTIAKLHGERS